MWNSAGLLKYYRTDEIIQSMITEFCYMLKVLQRNLIMNKYSRTLLQLTTCSPKFKRVLVACLNLNKVIRCSLNHIWILMSTYNFHYQENCKFKSLFCFSVFMYSGALVMQTRLLFLHRIFISKKSQNSPVSSTWSQLDETIDYSQVYIAPLDHLMQILPRQPNMVDFVVCRVCYG